MFPLNRAEKEHREKCCWGKAISELGLLRSVCHGADLSAYQSVDSHLLKKQWTKQENKLKQSFLQAVSNEFPTMLHLIFIIFWEELSLQKLKKLHEIFSGKCAMERTKAMAVGRRISEHKMLWSMLVSNKIESSWVEIKISCGAVAIFFKERSLGEEILCFFLSNLLLVVLMCPRGSLTKKWHSKIF